MVIAEGTVGKRSPVANVDGAIQMLRLNADVERIARRVVELLTNQSANGK